MEPRWPSLHHTCCTCMGRVRGLKDSWNTGQMARGWQHTTELHLQRERSALTQAHITRRVRVRARARARSHGGGERVRGDEELRLDCLGFFDRLRARIKGEG